MLSLTTETIRLIQRGLGMTGSQVDGVMGQKSERALDRFLAKKKDQLSPIHLDSILAGGRKRKATAFGQLIADEHELDPGPIDGLLGPQTDYALKILIFKIKHGRLPHMWRDHRSIPNPNQWPKEDPDALKVFYGKATKTGRKLPLKSIGLPYTHTLSWDRVKKVQSFKCHEKVADSILRVLTKVKSHYQADGIKHLGLDLWGGCFNFRKKRGGSRLSTHSWGIALDYFPDRNRLHWHWDRAVFATPDYDKWWQFWEEEGWTSLGRTRDFDWMHVQATSIPMT